NRAYDEHNPNREPWKKSVLEEERYGIYRAGHFGLRFYARNDWEHDPRARSVECGYEAHDANSAEKNEEAELNNGSHGPVIAPNLDPTQPGAKARRRRSFRLRNSGFLHLRVPIQRRRRTVGSAVAGQPIADHRLRPSLPRAPQAV